MNILVVGGAGYVGGPLCDFLISDSHKVKILDLLLYERNYFKPVELVRENVCDSRRPSLRNRSKFNK
jgi:nucleoside-diphosphate-sugar epimerase